MKPLYINGCFGWFHHASSTRGVVICPAFGIEELCTHRFMRHLADQLSEAGLPTVRIDYHGTGNSLGDDLEPQRLDAWLQSIRDAVAWLRNEVGVTEVVLVGFRLGSLLAAEAARQLGDIHTLVMLAPVVSGKAYLREMRALGMLIAQTARVVTPAEVEPFDGIEAAGFLTTSATTSALQKLDLMTVAPPAPRVLLMGKPDAPVDAKLGTHWLMQGATVSVQVLQGFAEMEWNSTFAELPPDVFLPAVEWLLQSAPAAGALTPVLPEARLEYAHWQEMPVHFGPQAGLFGVYCRPAPYIPAEDPLPAIVFINHGANHHIGWARMFVHFARAFAAQGIATLRIDISGLGDSPAHADRNENELYGRYLQHDVRGAVDWLQGRGHRLITLVGHCTGAHLGFYSALRDPRVANLVMLNLQRFFWERGKTLQDARKQAGFRSTDWYWSSLRHPATWKRLLTGDINTRAIASKIAQRLGNRLLVTLTTVFGPLVGHETLSRKVIRWLRELRDRDTHVLMVYCAEDGGLEEVATHLGPGARKARRLGNVEFHLMDGADHNITPPWAQQRYAQVLSAFVLKRTGRD